MADYDTHLARNALRLPRLCRALLLLEAGTGRKSEMEQMNQLDMIATRESKQFIGEFAWPTVLLVLCVSLVCVATPLLVKAAILPLWLGVLIMAVNTYGAYTALHEAVHGTISGRHTGLRWVNEAVGYCAACILGMPLTGHRHEHLTHHRSTNDPADDPDYVISEMCRSPWHGLRSSALFTYNQLSFFHRYRRDTAPAEQERRFWLEVLLSWTLRLAFIAWLGWDIGLWLLIGGPLLGSVITQYLFSYLVHLPHEAVGRYENTATYLVPGWPGKWVTFAWGYQNYHSVHHLFPRVPFYRYPALFKRIRPIMLSRGAPVYQLGRSGWRLLKPSEQSFE